MSEPMQGRAEFLQKWLQCAPKPPRRENRSYDVFISYRSSDRAWAMALYDVLKLAGWDAFLDQYDLVPGSDLETSLANGPGGQFLGGYSVVEPHQGLPVVRARAWRNAIFEGSAWEHLQLHLRQAGRRAAASVRPIGSVRRFRRQPRGAARGESAQAHVCNCAQALDVLTDALKYFPKSVRAKQLEGLALRRLKRYQEAIDVLSELKEAGHQDPETLGILAAAWDGLYQGSGKTLHLRTSRELYRTAFQNDPKDYYTGINAASKSLFLGEEKEAAHLASEVQPLVAKASDGEDLWPACTLAEVYLLQRNIDAAAAQYQKVIDKHPTAMGDLKGTGQQAQRICTALGLSPEQVKTVLGPFALLEQ